MPGPPSGPPRTVLVVDDDIFIGRALACILQEARQVRVLAARSGDEALPLALTARPDLILVDVNMPGMQALELCRRIRESPALGETPVYLLTGVLPGDEVFGALREYVQGILSKPPNPGELLAALDAALHDGSEANASST